jgi:hypothetical protein
MCLGLWGADPGNIGSPEALAAVLAQAGQDASVVLSVELQHRWPEASAAEVCEGLFESYDERLRELAVAVAWVGGAC